MAGDWIPMRVNLAEDPDVLAIAEAVKLDEFAVVGRLHRIWSWANVHTKDGMVKRVGPSWVDRMAACPGFAEAMVSVGWLSILTDGIKIPKFDDWNGKSGKTRLEDAKRKRKQREKETVESGPRPGNVTDLSGNCHGDVTEMSRENRDYRTEEDRTDEGSEKTSPPTASPGMNPTNNTTDLGLYWCFRTRAIGRKPTAQDVTAALDAMIQSGAVTLDEVRAAWTSGQFDWSQTFGVWRTAMQRAKEGKDAKRARQPPDEPSLPTIKEVREREAARLAELMKGER